MRLVAVFLVGWLVLVSPAVAGTDVGFDETFDFQKVRTYTWKKGVPAAYPQVQRWIENAIARELDEAGLRQAPPNEAELFVATTAVGATDLSVTGGYLHLDRYDVGVIGVDVRGVTSGTLLVSIVDAGSGKAVWGGKAKKMLGSNVNVNRDGEKIRKKIDRVVTKLFRDFPR